MANEMEIDFSQVDEAQGFTPIPEGKYLCELIDVKADRQTHAGDPMWGLKFQVSDGEYAGRYIFDNLVFSTGAMKRVKLICSRLGIDVSGKVKLTPELLLGKRVMLTVAIEEYVSEEKGPGKRNSVPFAGYEVANPGASSSAASGSAPAGNTGTGSEAPPF